MNRRAESGRNELRAQTDSQKRYCVVYRRSDDRLFPTKKRISFLVGYAHRPTENNQSAGLFPVLGRHLAMKKPDRPKTRPLLFQYLRKKSQILKRVVLKNQDLVHRALCLLRLV